MSELKAVRDNQRFQTTRARLQIQLEKTDAAREAREMEEQLEAEVQERQLVHTLALQVGGSPAPFDAEQTREEVRRRQERCRRAPGEQDDHLLCIYSELTPPTEWERLKETGGGGREQRRQQDAHATRLYCVLLVDGALVGTTGPTSLHPHDFCTRFDCSMLLQLLAFPRELSLQLRRSWAQRPAAPPPRAAPPPPPWTLSEAAAAPLSR